MVGTGNFRFTSCGTGHMTLVFNAAMRANGFTPLEYDIRRDLLTPGIEGPTPTR